MDISAILTNKYPGAFWALNGETYDGLDWRDETPKPTKATLEKLWPEVVAEIEAEKEAKEARKLSAIGKLEALGLTVDEVRDVFGIEV
jgi:hypothetical protein